MRQFGCLMRSLRECNADGPAVGRSWYLPLENRVLLVAAYYRTNLSMRQLAPLFGVSVSTVHRVIQRLGPFLAVEPAQRPAGVIEELWIADGRLIPLRGSGSAGLGQRHRLAPDALVVVDVNTRLVPSVAYPDSGAIQALSA
ncbi:transposase family protein [Streptomyces sp. AV19]|uniref:transposase family protein n=1 Tax=Streptomyces sp. AV19 TaxID=2793068 RepID=UPI0018FE3593|nr:transposase family protein [Streptomyces sp. AV19]MBH1937961.1 transposase family protein [Streptomyces sp. AV19]MDG4536900.1 transposase family protein [Streptomyces sp. AV19]